MVSTARLIACPLPGVRYLVLTVRKGHASRRAALARSLRRGWETRSGTHVLYQAYETHNRMLWPMRTFARSALDIMATPAPPLAAVGLAYPDMDAQRRMGAAFELIARARLP